jgi:hypothetical protein
MSFPAAGQYVCEGFLIGKRSAQGKKKLKTRWMKRPGSGKARNLVFFGGHTVLLVQ